jgi:hypothetical protein
MVLLSCSGTGGIYANLANGAARHNCARASLPKIQSAATALIEGLQWDNSIGHSARKGDLPGVSRSEPRDVHDSLALQPRHATDEVAQEKA